MAVDWRVGALLEKRLPDAWRNKNTTEGGVARGNALGEGDDIGLQFVAARREHLTGAAEASDDFIGNEQDVVLAAETLDLFKVTVLRRMHATGAHDRFSNVCSDVLGADTIDGFREGGGVVLVHALGPGNQRVGAIPLTVEIQTGDARAVGMQTVVRAFTADDDFFVRAAHMVP